MTLEHRATPCVTTDSREEWLEGLHFDSAEEALDVMRDAGVTAELVTLTTPCVLVVCETCTEYLEVDEILLHSLTAQEAEKAARRHGWLTPDGRYWYCQVCGLPEGMEQAPGPILVLEGQETLL